MTVTRELTRAKLAFPALPVSFFDVLQDMVVAEGFSDERFRDAITHVIRDIPYPTPTISNFVSFDQTYEVFTHPQMVRKVDELGPDIWKYYQATWLPGRDKPVWISKDDITKYNIKSEKPI